MEYFGAEDGPFCSLPGMGEGGLSARIYEVDELGYNLSADKEALPWIATFPGRFLLPSFCLCSA
jgi:hypothetical protein